MYGAAGPPSYTGLWRWLCRFCFPSWKHADMVRPKKRPQRLTQSFVKKHWQWPALLQILSFRGPLRRTGGWWVGMVPGTFKTKHMCTLIPLSCCFPWYGVKLLDYSLLCPIIKDNLGLIGHTANRGRDLTTEMGSGSTREGEGLSLLSTASIQKGSDTVDEVPHTRQNVAKSFILKRTQFGGVVRGRVSHSQLCRIICSLYFWFNFPLFTSKANGFCGISFYLRTC